jgi:C4-dicarboxylate-specific signal transduction histidine kinase
MSHNQFLAAFTPEDSKFIGEAFEKCGKFGVPWKKRAQVLIGNKKLWVEVVGHAKINPDGQIIGVYGTCQDIEGLVEAEEMTKLERTKAMHAAKLASLGEMSAGIAHEINNPLAIISANASLLMERELPREKVLEKLDRLVKASSRIGKIVGGLRKFARISDGKVHQVTSVKALFSELNFLTEVKSKRTNVPVTVNVETDAKIDCDEIEIQQVLINLINNAIDAAKGLSDKWVDVKGFEDKNEVVIQVWDSGPGIQPAIAAKIFEPFFTTKPVGEGTGLGLSITKGILDEHKAKIDVLQGVPNTCFEIRFSKAGENNEAAA